MKKSERCLEILEILQRERTVDVKDLAEKFAISEMTVRRDLKFLSEQYNITRTHGGAMLANQSVVKMISFDEDRILNREDKGKIAALAAAQIKSGQRIFVDAGSTTRIMLNYLDEETRAVVVTPHLKVAEHALQYDNLSVIMLGGEMLKIANCSAGAVTEEQLRKYQLDTAFIGAAAIGTDGRLYDGFSPEARLKSSLFSVAKKIYLLADSSKFNTYDLNEFASLTQVDAVITDAGLNDEARNLLKRYQVKIMIAE